MGNLTSYLEREFARQCPQGWTCRYEAPVLAEDWWQLLGYAPRADVLLERADGSQRLWIEFEVSRADPVANHAKFATAHLFQPWAEIDTFVSMVSRHVAGGRRNLAANTIALMRHLGMNAFQTILFPHIPGSEIKRINHLALGALASENLAVREEIDRALTVVQPVLTTSRHRIHFVGDMLEVMLNLQQWNQDIRSPEGKATWGKRTVRFFVYDLRFGLFAPSKFCAYLAILASTCHDNSAAVLEATSRMTIPVYATLDGTDSRFDGHRARMHLANNLSMASRDGDDAAGILPHFQRWLSLHADSINVHPDGPVFIVPPEWIR